MWVGLILARKPCKEDRLVREEILPQDPAVLVAQSWLTLCDSMNCSPQVSSVHGILQARILEWVAISFSKQGSSPGLLHGRWILNLLSYQGRPPLTHAWVFTLGASPCKSHPILLYASPSCFLENSDRPTVFSFKPNLRQWWEFNHISPH